MGVRGLLRRVGPAVLVLAGVALPAAATAQTPGARAVDRTYRGSQAEVLTRADELIVDASAAVPALEKRLRSAAPVRVTAACSADVVGLDLTRPRPGRDFGGDAVVAPDPATLTVRLTVPGLAQRIAGDADGCRATIAEPGGYRIGEVAVGFTQRVRRRLYTQSLRTADRDRRALAAAEAAVTSALTYYVGHGNDLRGWRATADGRVPGEAVLRLGTAVSVGAVGLVPAADDVVRQVVPPHRARSRHHLVLVAPSTALHGRLVVVERDFDTGVLRYSIVDRLGRVRYRSGRPPFGACSDPLDPARCADAKPRDGRRAGPAT
ncbi:hypothetical protein DSM112329_01191 [Paraconexibacter sp. AEG42_29]|uniref:Uncharacterized protein n=1 Tax=Paraconexibacter sp. AEG42_29 TaxID=2997339 RepID=A0AAU7ASK0_9ACTN